MKKTLLIVLCLLNFVFMFEYSIIRDDNLYLSLTSKRVLQPSPVIMIDVQSISDYNQLLKWLEQSADKSGVSFYLQQHDSLYGSNTSIAYGEFFNDHVQNVYGIDYTSLTETRYLSTRIYDEHAMLIPHFNELPMTFTDRGKSVRYGYTLKPISYFRIPDPESTNFFDSSPYLYLHVVEEDAKDFVTELSKLNIQIIDVGESTTSKDNLVHNLNNLYLIMAYVLIIGFTFIYNESQHQRRFVNQVLGVSKIEYYIKNFLVPLCAIAFLSFLPLSLYLLIRYFNFPVLIDDGHRILMKMLPILLGSSFIATILIVIENKLNKHRQSLSLWVSSLLKTALLLMIIPAFVIQLVHFDRINKEVKFYKRIMSRYSDSFTLSNEMYLNSYELEPIDMDTLTHLRQNLDDMGAIFFDATIHQDYHKKSIARETIPEIKSSYRDFIKDKTPFQLKTIYVNDNYLIQEGIIDQKYPDVSLIIVPTEHVASVRESIKTFPACQEIPCQIIEKNVTIDNISLHILSDIDQFKHPILFSSARNIKPLKVIFNATPMQSMNEAQVAGVFYLSTIVSNEHLNEVESLIEDVGDAYTISINDRVQGMLDAQKKWLIELTLQIALYASLIGFLVIQSIKNYQSVYSKEIAVKMMLGYSYFESIGELIISNFVIYGMIAWLLLSGSVPVMLGVKAEEMAQMNPLVALGVIGIIVILELGIQGLYGLKFKKELSDKLKGEQDE